VSEPLRVVIADDHPIYRSGLKLSLSSMEGFEVVGEASNGEEAVAATAALNPDVIVMDVNMPGLNGVDATRRITQADPEQAVLMLTMFDDADSVFAAMRAGARGYVVKGSGEDEIVAAIRAVSQGQAIFSASVAARVISFFGSAKPAAEPAAFPELTDREREVLELIALGVSNPVIATRLGLSPKTIRNNVSNIFLKLQVADRAQAIVKAREAGMGKSSKTL
jgi:DNA-binding NarL/FixJ family response regulator